MGMRRWGGGQMREKVILLSPSPHPLIPPSSSHAQCPMPSIFTVT